MAKRTKGRNCSSKEKYKRKKLLELGREQNEERKKSSE